MVLLTRCSYAGLRQATVRIPYASAHKVATPINKGESSQHNFACVVRYFAHCRSKLFEIISGRAAPLPARRARTITGDARPVETSGYSFPAPFFWRYVISLKYPLSVATAVPGGAIAGGFNA